MTTETIEHLVKTESGTLEIEEECYEGKRFVRRTVTTVEEVPEDKP